MKHKLKHIIKKAKIISLSSQEKDEIKASLLKHMESHPLVPGSGGFVVPEKVSYLEWVGENWNNRKFLMPAVFCLIFLFTGGISFASNWSLPGSLLYPVKILNEKVNSAFAFDSKSKARVFASNAMNRLEEAEKLFIEGRLDEETEIKLAESFREDSNVVEESIINIEREDKESSVQTALSIKGELDRHQKILHGFSFGDNGSPKTKLSEKVDEVIAELSYKAGISVSSEDEQDTTIENKKNINIQNKAIMMTRTQNTGTRLTSSSTIEGALIEDQSEVHDKGDEDGPNNSRVQDGDEEVHDNEIKTPEIKIEVNGGAGVTVPGLGL